MLHGLEREGLLRGDVRVVGGHQRKEYRLTPEGARTLDAARAHLHDLAGEVLHGEGPATIRDEQRTDDDG